MAGKRVEVLVSPTDSMSKILNALHDISLGGSCSLSTAVHVAQLALKHRREKKGSQRVIVFVASPVLEDDAVLKKSAKLLKKNNIAVDIVSFGDASGKNEVKLQAFVETANSNNNSHYLAVPLGNLPSDMLVSSPILHGGEGGGSGGAGGGFVSAGGSYGGVDPSMDPELALALRVSMEEERARQESASAAALKEENGAGDDAKKPAANTNDESDDLMAKALAMSMQQSDSGLTGNGNSTEDEEMQAALALSMQSATSSSSTEETKSDTTTAQAPPAPAPSAAAFLDAGFVNTLLSGLPGVDPNDPKIKAAMEQIQKSNADPKNKKKDGDDESKK